MSVSRTRVEWRRISFLVFRREEVLNNVPLLDLKRQYESIQGEVEEAVLKVIRSGRYILSENVSKLEEEVARYCGTKYGISVASGTDALILSLVAMGIKEGDEVITSPFTFIATTEAIAKVRATPVFADIDPDTFNIDVKQIEKKITKKTRMILPVHLYGQSCDMDPILKIAKKYNLKVVEDCAQSIGAEYKGKKVASFGDAGCFSFYPTKNLGAYGDGGMIVTNNQELTEMLRAIRVHGEKKKYYHFIDGYNSRLDEVQAAILRIKLKYLDKWTMERNKNAEVYRKLLQPIAQKIQVPVVPEYNRHVYYLYTLKANEKRDELLEYLKSNQIGSCVYYPVPLHMQEVYKDLGYQKGGLPVSEDSCEKLISIPMYPELDDKSIEYVSRKISEFYK